MDFSANQNTKCVCFRLSILDQENTLNCVTLSFEKVCFQNQGGKVFWIINKSFQLQRVQCGRDE